MVFYVLAQSTVIDGNWYQIATTVQQMEKVAVGVLGLAPRHWRKLKLKRVQVRGVDQTPYPSQLHGASLATAMQRPCRPLQFSLKLRWSFQENRDGMRTPKQRKKFYICSDVSHTHTHWLWGSPETLLEEWMCSCWGYRSSFLFV